MCSHLGALSTTARVSFLAGCADEQDKAFWLLVTVLDSYGLRDMCVACPVSGRSVLPRSCFVLGSHVEWTRCHSDRLHPQSSTLFDALQELNAEMHSQLPTLHRHLVRRGSRAWVSWGALARRGEPG